ncbi:MAG: ABC transporter permease subunit [Leptonema sp. (in: Bacteria)]|nr:ABC transporter permease subunit [Leptonema sp. (in: bacteria)]
MAEMKYIAKVADYLWGGWGAASSIFLFLALWQFAATDYPEIVLPAPATVFKKLLILLSDTSTLNQLTITTRRSLIGFGLAFGGGLLGGLLAGSTAVGAMFARPWMSILLGTPPIAWLVLAILWFGTGDGAPIATVCFACLPIIFLQAMQGARTLNGELSEMAKIYRLQWFMRWQKVYLPHILSYVLPATITALGIAWKVVVMAELFATSDGVGAALANARSWLDTPAALAWITAIVAILLTAEYAVLEPIKRYTERWREAA